MPGAEGLPVQLFLWPECEEGIDLSRLRATREALTTWRRSPATMVSYGSDWLLFSDWCQKAGRTSLPAAVETVSLYLVWMLEERGLRVSTASRRLSAIIYKHTEARLPAPSDSTVWDLLTSCKKRRREKPNGKVALTVEQLRRACDACDIGTVGGVRDRAILVFGFATGLRRSELAGLNVSDVLFEPGGLAVTVTHSKTDQAGRGRVVGVFPGVFSSTDPVRTLQAWLTMRGDRPGALFTRLRYGLVTLERLAPQSYAGLVKAAVERIGLRPGAYGAHSLRAGLVTAAAERGASDSEIMFASGHASAVVMRSYIRSQRLFARRNPLAGAL